MANFELDTESVRKIALLLKETGLNEIEYEEGDRRIRCVASAPVTAAQMPMMQVPMGQMAPMGMMPGAPAASAPEAKPEIPAGTQVTSPMVGTVYLSPGPNLTPFIKVGDKVKEGDTLVIIEAMKVMNPIKATKAGTVVEIMVEDAKPVEFGEPLLVIA